MKKFKIKILKEEKINETLPAIEKVVPNAKDKTLLIVAGDSIAVGLCYWALGTTGAKLDGSKFINSIPGYPAIRGGRRARWINANLDLKQYEKHPGKKILIIIAGTNDAINWAGGGRITAKQASKEISSMTANASAAGFDYTIMKLHSYTGVGRYRREGAWLEKHQSFVEEFNNLVGSSNRFDMVTPTDDGVHTPYNPTANGKLLQNALSSLNVKASDLIVPVGVNFRRGANRLGALKSNMGTSTASISNKVKKGVCKPNPYCNIIDRAVFDQITIKTAQKALKDLGETIELTGTFDSQTKSAIMSFQKKQQFDQNGYKPPGREFLRCDACIGINTLAAIKAALKSIGKELKAPSPEEIKQSSAKISIKSIKPVEIQKATDFPETNTTRPYQGRLYQSYTVDVIYEIAKRWAPASATDQDIKYMAAIGMAESGGIPAVNFHSVRHGDDSHGIWQINMINRLGPYRRKRYGLTSDDELKNPNINCQIAWDLWRSRRGSGLRKFRDWSVTWKTKSSGRGYRRFQKALGDLERKI